MLGKKRKTKSGKPKKKKKQFEFTKREIELDMTEDEVKKLRKIRKEKYFIKNETKCYHNNNDV